jgi:hypothetical protein
VSGFEFNKEMKMRKFITSQLKKLISQEHIWRYRCKSQNNNEEAEYLLWLGNHIEASKSFVEFGFGVYEFNSVELVKSGYRGLLIDASQPSCDLANQIFEKLRLNVTAVPHWIEIDSLVPIIDFVKALNGDLGVLNIDIDGNDFWILRRLIEQIHPEIICVEHNASFGLRPISTPYKPNFDRMLEHPSGMYHGASIAAFCILLQGEYSLVKNIAGLNLIFVRNDKLKSPLKVLTPSEGWSEHVLRNLWHRSTAQQQWEQIKHLDYVELGQAGDL